MNEKQLLEMINALPPGRHTIAIDGRCAAGKSTLADSVAGQIGASVIHMDDFFLPMHMRTPERLQEPGGNVDYERFRQEVLPYLGGQEDFSYQAFDCSTMKPGEWRRVSAARFTIVEGAYSCHPKLGDYMSLRIFMDVESKLQQERIKKRNGEERLEVFLKKWIPMEEAYINAYAIAKKADLILKEK